KLYKQYTPTDKMQAPNPVLNPEHIIKYGTEKKITKKDKKQISLLQFIFFNVFLTVTKTSIYDKTTIINLNIS
ncbi:hypothetical protein PN608_19950, partial [Parabacteroides distasonis]|uniref:hypothetical protein n=1 Tax=Parabacteroides distasonis TaxID=823 RepID=UPI00232DA9F7